MIGPGSNKKGLLHFRVFHFRKILTLWKLRFFHLSASSFICGRGQTLPSIEKTPSVTINLHLKRSTCLQSTMSNRAILIVIDINQRCCCYLNAEDMKLVFCRFFRLRVLFGPRPSVLRFLQTLLQVLHVLVLVPQQRISLTWWALQKQGNR